MIVHQTRARFTVQDELDGHGFINIKRKGIIDIEHQECTNDTLAAVTLLDSGGVGRAERCRPTRTGVHIDCGDRADMLRPPGELQFSVRMALMGRYLRTAYEEQSYQHRPANEESTRPVTIHLAALLISSLYHLTQGQKTLDQSGPEA